MASHHQPYHPCHHPIPTSTTTSSSCYCCHYSSYTPSHHPLPPDPHPASSALHLHLHHPTPTPPPPQPHHFSPYAPQTPQTHQHHPSQHHPQNPHHFQELPPHHHHQHQKEELTQPIISSLIHRISALEASLKRYSSSSSFKSLRDAAARTIQTHFRAFLVRRSRTLWQLKELASIKSTLIALKSSVSENTHFDSQSLSRKAMVLLRKLNSIQSGDPMIKDGKRSITRELNRLMEFIDGVSVKRNEISSRVVKNVKCGGNNNKYRDLSIGKKRVNVESVKVGRHVDEMEKLRERIERINEINRISEVDVEEDEELDNPALSLVRRRGILIKKSGGLTKENTGAQAKEKRSVRFAEDGNAYRVFRSSHGSLSNGDCNSVEGSDSNDAEGELTANLGREVEEIAFSSKEKENDDEEGQSEDEGSPQSSDGEKDANYKLTFRDDIVMNSHDQGEDGNFVFSAPLPVKMESRADLMNKRKSVKV